MSLAKLEAYDVDFLASQTILPASIRNHKMLFLFILGAVALDNVIVLLERFYKDLTDRIRKKLQEKAKSSVCIRRPYITIPKTCQPTPIETNTEKYPKSDHLIENLGRLQAVKFTSSGTVNRPYELVMYKMTTKETKLPGGRTEICFLAEQDIPSFTLFSMSQKYSDAGLSPEYLVEQASDFSELCSRLIAGQDFKEKVADIEKLCRFVYFDNKSKTVQDSLLEEIRKDLSLAVDLVA